MPQECKIANVRSDIEMFIGQTVNDYGLPPYEVSGILSNILNYYKDLEIINLNKKYNDILKTINESSKKEDK